jgi:hypothetical protein
LWPIDVLLIPVARGCERRESAENFEGKVAAIARAFGVRNGEGVLNGWKRQREMFGGYKSTESVEKFPLFMVKCT